MVKYAAEATEVVNLCWKREKKLAKCDFDDIPKKLTIMEGVGNGTIRIFIAAILLEPEINNLATHDLEMLMRLLQYPSENLQIVKELPQR